MANRHKLLDDDDDDEFSLSTRIKNGARAIAMAMDSDDSSLLEEAVLCLCVVVTNAVEVQDSVGRSVGIAVYDTSFSWINHSCSPNAWYRFLPPDNQGGTQCLLIRPASSSSNGIQLPIDISDPPTGWRRVICGGPRLVVRSIKQIKKGELVTIAYTDLLQPKELRQLELWSKYRFTCCCHRCVAVPLTYVDHCLQLVSTSGGNLFNDVGAEESLKEHVDDAIHDYLSSNDAESCCKKLENVLLNGFLYEEEQVVIRLHPQHHLSLNAYTTLASAYKVRARAMDDEDASLKMNRFSAAYSLLLALLTHPFFLSESCLIDCVSNFWIGAGESLLNLARSLKGMYDSGSELPSVRCSRCGLMDVFKDGGLGCNKVSNELLHCSITSNIIPKVWELVIYGNRYLEAVRDPTIDFFSNNSNNNQKLSLEGITQGVEEDFVFQAAVHCLLHGGILSNISGGHGSHFSYVRGLLSV